MREVGDVHRELYPENAELYGENIRGKVERCIDVTDGEYDAALRARSELAERAGECLAGFDLLLTPTLAFVPPPADVVETEQRAEFVRFTFPFNALGWPALALPAGPRRTGCRPRCRSSGVPATTASSWRPASCWKPRSRPRLK